MLLRLKDFFGSYKFLVIKFLFYIGFGLYSLYDNLLIDDWLYCYLLEDIPNSDHLV